MSNYCPILASISVSFIVITTDFYITVKTTYVFLGLGGQIKCVIQHVEVILLDNVMQENLFFPSN